MRFKDILGHSREVGLLMNSMSSGKVAHSLLFSGPDGIGKRSVATAFAGALNCASGAQDACGACADCLMMDSSTHPNVMEVTPLDKDGEKDPGGLIRIEQVREVQNALRYRVDRGMKAVIVDGADRLVPAAANAFLKTLEEPPPGSVIVLVTSKPSELLPTILSRCQRISFQPLAEELVKGWLVEKKGLPSAEAGAASRLSGGSISRAIAYLSDGAHSKRKEIMERLSAIKAQDVDEALKFAEELSKRDDLVETLEFMKCWYRDLVVACQGMPHLAINTEAASGACEDPQEAFSRLASSFWAIEEARRSVAPPRYGNKQLAMEALVLKLTGAQFN